MAALSKPGPGALARYEGITPLASGGMAEIFLARLRGAGSFARPVVIKRMHPHLARDPSFVSMFLDEARIVAAVRHPNVVQVHDFVHDGDDLVMILEYVEGETLAQIAAAAARGFVLDRVLAAGVIADVCAGLHAAHELDDGNGAPLHVVHRDVSPQNVMVAYDGHVKLLDFGIAKANARRTRTETGHVKGKQSYMSPEQCLGKPLDRRSDVFALGVLLYELTTGKRLFDYESPLVVLKAICELDIPSPRTDDPDYPMALDAICRRALARRPEDRYATALEMRRDLLDAIQELGGAGLDSEALARWMKEAFAERMGEKRHLLSEPPSLVPNVDAPAEPVSMRTKTRAGRSIALALVGALVVATTIVVGLRMLRPHASTTTPMTAMTATPSMTTMTPSMTPSTTTSAPPPTQPSALGDAPPSITASAAPATTLVDIEVRSVPSGARITAGGASLGVTPATIHLPRATTAVPLVLTRDGYLPATESVTPDEEQRLLIHLSLRPKKPSTNAAAATTASSPFKRFE